MRQHELVLLSSLAASGCGGEHSGGPPELTFETYFAGLDGQPCGWGNGCSSDERRDALVPELEAEPVDVLCLQGVWAASDRRHLVESLVGVYPYSLEAPTNETTPVDDPIETEPAEAACGASDIEALDTQIACMENQCASVTEADDADETVASFACVAASCSAPADRGRCHQCLHGEWRSGATFREMRARCTTPRPVFAQHGEHGLLLLSKLPLESPSLHVLPSRWLRRAVIGATVQVAGPVHVYCTALGPTEEGGLPGDPFVHDPYVTGAMASSWAEEQRLQAERLVAHVNALTDSGRAIVLGTFNAGDGYRTGSDNVVVERGIQTVEVLAAAFVPGVAPGYEPACTLCPDNILRFEEYWTEDAPLDLGSRLAPIWTNRIYLRGLEQSAVRTSVRTRLAQLLPFWQGAPAPVRRIALSAQYGFASRIAIDP